MLRVHNASRTHTAHAIEPLEYKAKCGLSSGKVFKKQAKKAARQLGYPNSVIDRIENADSEEEINRIMATARKEKFDESV